MFNHREWNLACSAREKNPRTRLDLFLVVDACRACFSFRNCAAARPAAGAHLALLSRALRCNITARLFFSFFLGKFSLASCPMIVGFSEFSDRAMGQWSGILSEMLTREDDFFVTFVEKDELRLHFWNSFHLWYVEFLNKPSVRGINFSGFGI